MRKLISVVAVVLLCAVVTVPASASPSVVVELDWLGAIWDGVSEWIDEILSRSDSNNEIGPVGDPHG